MIERARLIASFVMVSACLVGMGSLCLFCVFMFMGPLYLVRFDLSEWTILAWDGLLSIAFFVAHSGMIRRGFRARASSIIPAYYHGALFAILSGILLTTLLVLWQPSAVLLYQVQGSPRWIARGFFFLAAAATIWCAFATSVFDLFGLTAIKAHLQGKLPPPPRFVVRGLYLWVRHPIYFIQILMMWSYPDLTADRLLFNVLWTMWMYVGTVLEEADLISDFGQAYRDYQRKVSMLIPWRVPSARNRGSQHD
jgi:protein-S-isoprenylcysteine O-methyltransferase Ste14